MIATLKRGLAIAGATILLAGCQVIPNGEGVETTGPVTTGPQVPNANTLPTDNQRHRIALLVPLSGTNANAGQSIANATTMALLDTGADNIRITTYDTATGAGVAASRAIADGNKLILGPLMRDNVGAVLAQARPSDVPLITFSNDASVARNDVFVMGHVPEQSITRSIDFAYGQGARRFAALVPQGEYGARALAAARAAITAKGAQLVAIEEFDRRSSAAASAARRLEARGGFDTVLIADGSRLAMLAASELKEVGDPLPSIIGTELWSGEDDLTRNVALRGAWFSAIPDDRFRQFKTSYTTRFGSDPYRIATLGYDAVLLSLRVARDWQPGSDFPTSQLLVDGGFVGVDRAIRFRSNGVGERAFEVRQVDNGSFSIVDAAPTGF